MNSILIFDEADEILGDLQQRYLTAVSDDDYISMMADLTSLSIPASVDITKSVESLPFYPTEEGIDLDILKEIGGGDYGDDEEGYKNAVISWNAKNSKAKISSKEFTENFKEGSQELLNTFEINIGNNPELSGAYFIIPNFIKRLFSQYKPANLFFFQTEFFYRNQFLINHKSILKIQRNLCSYNIQSM